MRTARTRLLALALAVTGLAAGCTTTGPAPDATGSATSTHSVTPSTAPTPTGAAATPAPTATPPVGGVTASPGDDRQGDPVHGVRTLTGRVERSGACTTLVLGAQRWALVGVIANSLKAGDTVRVTGTITQEPTACLSLNPTAALLVTRTDSP